MLEKLTLQIKRSRSYQDNLWKHLAPFKYQDNLLAPCILIKRTRDAFKDVIVYRKKNV